MILNTPVESFINSHYQAPKGDLGELQKFAYENDYPIISNEVLHFLSTILKISRPKEILEIGCCIGFSANLMASLTNANITTIERYSVMIEKAKINIEKYGYKGRIRLIEGSAIYELENLVKQGKKYDFIFLDAAKGQYNNFLPFLLDLLEVDGVLLADNILQNGDIAKDREEIVKRHRTIHKNMRDFLQNITNNDILQTTIVPIGDGLTLTVKLGELQ